MAPCQNMQGGRRKDELLRLREAELLALRGEHALAVGPPAPAAGSPVLKELSASRAGHVEPHPMGGKSHDDGGCVGGGLVGKPSRPAANSAWRARATAAESSARTAAIGAAVASMRQRARVKWSSCDECLLESVSSGCFARRPPWARAGRVNWTTGLSKGGVYRREQPAGRRLHFGALGAGGAAAQPRAPGRTGRVHEARGGGGRDGGDGVADDEEEAAVAAANADASARGEPVMATARPVMVGNGDEDIGGDTAASAAVGAEASGRPGITRAWSTPLSDDGLE